MKAMFEPSRRECEFRAPEKLAALAARAGVHIEADCGGAGVCGRCRVRVLSGEVSPVTAAERAALPAAELEAGWRLACMAEAAGDCALLVPDSWDASAAKRRAPALPPDFAPDAAPGLGAAFDIGTTTVAGILYDLASGAAVAAASRANPQGRHGADVISRIAFCDGPGGLAELNSLIIGCINDMLLELTPEPGRVAALSVCGNTTMSHIFLGIDPSPLARSPFAPRFLVPPVRTAGELGVIAAPEAPVRLLPNVAGHVGGDITGVMLAARMTGRTLAVDVGTNGEVVLQSGGRRFACSTAAGPAFEGAAISRGMRAAPGAIERVRIENGRPVVGVIGGGRAEGICGSGLIDCVAAMLDSGIIDKKGRMAEPEYGLAGGVTVTRKDIREVQLAKAAIAAGMAILMREAGITADALDRVLLAGAFGSHIDAAAALRIGLLPPVPVERVTGIGNAAAAGAAMALLSAAERESAARLAAETKHVELATHADFQSEYVRHMYF